MLQAWKIRCDEVGYLWAALLRIQHSIPNGYPQNVIPEGSSLVRLIPLATLSATTVGKMGFMNSSLAEDLPKRDFSRAWQLEDMT